MGTMERDAAEYVASAQEGRFTRNESSTGIGDDRWSSAGAHGDGLRTRIGAARRGKPSRTG